MSVNVSALAGLDAPTGLPTVLNDVPPDAGILGAEIFGPVAPVVRFSSGDEVIRMANDTEFGLVSYLYCGDLRRLLRVADALEAGMVGINHGIVSDPAAPFGGQAVRHRA